MNNNTIFEIPIDDKIQEFGHHLKSHPRAIVSARFGDGKTYFLSKFIEHFQDNFRVITIHPINYQVLENKDIFELIKRDVLFQITVNNMLDESIIVDDKTAFSFYIQNNFMSVAESVFLYLNQINASPKTTKSVLAALGVNKLYKKLTQKVLDTKKKYKTEEALEEFFDKTEQITILEEDVITKIIQDSIDSYKKKNPNQRIVLLIEDMDRLDPAHLFRILNVFSAHLDTDEKYFIQKDIDCFYNKFRFDNVVFVMDYDNTEKIFTHFYGHDTNFEGYIQKFASKGIFRYSLKEEQCKYIYTRIVQLTNLPQTYITAVIPYDILTKKNIREVVDSFDDIDSQIKEMPVYNNKPLNIGILRLYIIMIRLKIDKHNLVTAFRNVYNDVGDEIIQHIIGYLAILFDKYNHEDFDCYGIYNSSGLYNITIGQYNSTTKLFNNTSINSLLSLPYNHNEVLKNKFDDWPMVLNRFASE